MVSAVRNNAAIALANSLHSIIVPEGFTKLGQTKQSRVPGLSTDTALNLFNPMVNVIDQQNVLLRQRMFQRLEDKPERVDARTVQNRMRTRIAPENPALKRTPQQVLKDLNAKFGQSGGLSTPFASLTNRPTESELFGSTYSGFTRDSNLTLLQTNRVAVSRTSTVRIADLQVAPPAATPEKVVVRLDSSDRSDADGKPLLSAEGRLFLNGVELAAGEAHELAYADFLNLEYVAGSNRSMDYLSVMGLDETDGTRSNLVTTAITVSGLGVERRIKDGHKTFEFIALAERNVFLPRASIEFTGDFAGGDILSAIQAGLIELTVEEYGNPENRAVKLLSQSSGNSIDVSFLGSTASDGIVVKVKSIDNSVEITDIRVTFS